jgi:hypothetical protein
LSERRNHILDVNRADNNTGNDPCERRELGGAIFRLLSPSPFFLAHTPSLLPATSSGRRTRRNENFPLPPTEVSGGIPREAKFYDPLAGAARFDVRRQRDRVGRSCAINRRHRHERNQHFRPESERLTDFLGNFLRVSLQLEISTTGGIPEGE